MNEHDYDPRNDYEIWVDQLNHPLLKIARERINRIAASPEAFFERAHIYPAREGMGKEFAMYCNGAHTEPVLLINLDAHRDYEDQTASVTRALHEL